MKRYMLIQIIEREISYEFFNTLEEAQEKMREQFRNCCSDISEKIDDGDASIGDMIACVNDGYNHDNYDWYIIDLQN